MDTLAGFRQIPIKTWFLTFEGALPDISSFGNSVQLEKWKNPEVDKYLEIYKEVGSAWGWTSRLLKTREELDEILKSANNEVWLFKIKDEVAGFFELVRSETEIMIVYLGLKPAWIRKGQGKKLIQAAVFIAGQNGEKVWLHTCDHDHPSALSAYQKAGFKIEKESISLEYYPE